jgi:hypothetical protein
MRMFSMLLTLLACAALTMTACDKKSGDAGGDKAPEAAAAAAAGPVEQDSAAFIKEFQGLKGMAAMKRYKNGVTVSGAVKRTITEQNGAFKIQLDAGDKKWLSLSFTDKGVAAKAAAPKTGDAFKAKCKIGGGMDAYVMLLDCEKL